MYFRGAQAAHIVPSTPLSHTLCASVRSTLQHPHPVPLPRHRHRVFASASPPLLLLCFWLWLCWRRCCLDRYFYVRAQIHAHKLLPWQRQQQQQQHSTGTNFLFLPHPGWKKKSKTGLHATWNGHGHGWFFFPPSHSFSPCFSLYLYLTLSSRIFLFTLVFLLRKDTFPSCLSSSFPLSVAPFACFPPSFACTSAATLQRCNSASALFVVVADSHIPN